MTMVDHCCPTTSKIFLNTVDLKVNNELLEDLNRLSISPDKFRKIHESIKTMLIRRDWWFLDELPFELREHPCFSDLNVEYIGSTGEGLSISEISESGVNEELDLTAILKTVTASQCGQSCTEETWLQIEYSKEQPGYVFLKTHMNENSHDWCGLCNIMSNSDGSVNEFYLSPVAFTDEFYMMLCLRCSFENMRYAAFCTDAPLCGNNQEDSKEKNCKGSPLYDGNQEDNKNSEAPSLFYIVTQEGPAVKTTLLSESDFSVQYDCCLAVRCLEWPIVANEFKDRQRTSGFPSNELVIQLISLGCLIVPKYPLRSNTMLEWRLSFCLIERKIMLNLTASQKKCYLLFKAIWRKFLCPPIGKSIQSYHLKNVFLWECETIPKKEWTDDLMIGRVTGLLQRLQHNLFTRHCPHYILPANNLFNDIDHGLLFLAGMRVHTCIFESKVVWIDNDSLLVLPAHKTRTSLGKNLRSSCIKILKNVIKSIVSSAMKGSETDFKPHRALILDKDSLSVLESELNKSFSRSMTKMISSYIQSASLYFPVNITRDYICSRADPKQLLVASKDGLLDGIAGIVNSVMTWGDIIEVITALEILETENIKQYGYSDAMKAVELMKLKFRMGFNTFGNEDDDDDNDDDDGSEDENLDTFICDGCEIQITGIRYHCNKCEDFDLCDECHCEVKHPHEFTVVSTEDPSNNGDTEDTEKPEDQSYIEDTEDQLGIEGTEDEQCNQS